MFARRLTRFASAQSVAVRRMGDHAHGHAPEYTGLDKIVRKYLPKDFHVVFGVLGFYTSLFLLYKLTKSKKVEAPAAVVAVPATSGDEVPSIESPEFEQWLVTPGNLEKLCV